MLNHREAADILIQEILESTTVVKGSTIRVLGTVQGTDEPVIMQVWGEVDGAVAFHINPESNYPAYQSVILPGQVTMEGVTEHAQYARNRFQKLFPAD